MKLTSFTGTGKAGIKCFKPAQYLLLVGTGVIDNAKVTVRVQDSETGKTDDIVSDILLDTLAKIATVNEGYYVRKKTATGGFIVPVILSPDASVRLSNNRYLDIEVKGLAAGTSMDVYAVESPDQTDFFIRYNKMFVPKDETQKQFMPGINEDMFIYHADITEIQLAYVNGATVTYTPAELEMLEMVSNDVCSVNTDGAVFGLGGLVHIDLAGIRSIDIKTSGAKAVEFYMIDMR